MAHPLWISLSADIFTGQMIASLIVLTFVAVFLLREWISQNARPGVFEEEEAVLDEPHAIQPLLNPPLVPHAPVQQHQVAVQPPAQAPILDPLPQHQLDPIQPVNEPQKPQVGAIDPDHWFTPPTAPVPPTQDRRQKKKSRARHSDTDDDRHSSHRPRMLDSEDDASPHQRELIKRKMFHRRIHVARTTAARRRGYTPLQESSAPLAVPEQKTKFNFTFKAPSTPLIPDGSSNVESSVPSGLTNANSNSRLSPFPSVALQPPTADIPFSLRRWQQATPNGSGSSIPQSYPPRPVLLTASRPPQSSGSNLPFGFSPGRTPTDSSSLATYRPPEELQAEAGPSNSSGYLNQRKEYFNDEVDQAFEAVGEESEEEHTFGRLGPEHGRYFRDPDDTSSDEEEVEKVEQLRDRLSLQEFLNIDFEEDIGELGLVNDQARRPDGPLADDDDDEDEDDDGLFHEGEDEDEEPDAGEELFDQWDENEAEAEAIRPQGAPIGAAAGALARAGNQVGEVVPAAVAAADNEEANVEDDMEGAMEGWSYSCGLF